MITIALDAFGSSGAPLTEIKGAVAFISDSPPGSVRVLVAGPAQRIREILQKEAPELSSDSIQVVNAPEIIKLTDPPGDVLKSKADSSMKAVIDLLKVKRADVAVSMGNTGAMMALSSFITGRVEGIGRPAIPIIAPVPGGEPVIIIDGGANVDCRPPHLAAFGLMGSVLYSHLFDIKSPKVAILNIGKSSNKGGAVVQEAYERLLESGLNFIGNVESGAVLSGVADVVVCDGFVGNIFLKFAESIPDLLDRFAGGSLIGPDLKGSLSFFNRSEYGGAPLLGVKGSVVIGHSNIDAKGVRNALSFAAENRLFDISGKIESFIKSANNKIKEIIK
ncbi:MAG: phosphate acyltransferase [Fibrobacterota bacterium]